MTLHEGITADELPDLFKFQGGAVLVVVPGRAPNCLRCRMKGHIRRDCRTPRCTTCRAFGHERQDCVRTYATVIGATPKRQDIHDLMDEVEAEEAASPTTKGIIETSQGSGCEAGTLAAPQEAENRRSEKESTAPVATEPSDELPVARPVVRSCATRRDASVREGDYAKVEGGTSVDETEQRKETDKVKGGSFGGDQGALVKMDVDPALVKRRREEDDAEPEREQRQLECEWKKATGKKGKYVPRARAASLTRGSCSDE
ncbi:hypothetical protein HPB52_021465 [Rhipicephalus sanguineus]|uniref:CCHC-type domain-containing protein n=1 Tax=Rhipicephalus sanguineus TaxID=34632 RepID=A0A9D4PV48_RHISA|nr:hypothetical protein HPB52_021465 [Rhipicephalus sanguineus]